MQVFISYSNLDRDTAERVNQELRDAGFETWSDQLLMPGDNWSEEIVNALEESDAVLVLVTPNSLKSAFVQHEWANALRISKRIVPVLLGSLSYGDLPLELSSRQGVILDLESPASIGDLVGKLRNLTKSSEPPISDSVDVDKLSKTILKEVEKLIDDRFAEFEVPKTSSFDSELVFVVTSFRADMEPTYEAIRDAAKKFGLRAERVKDREGDYRITETMIDMIKSAFIVVVDLTHERPNVYYELGYARALGKTVITIARQGTEIHFDVYDWKYHEYADSRPLEKKLIELFEHEVANRSAGS